jgi:pre-mRNA-splicing factor CWC22
MSGAHENGNAAPRLVPSGRAGGVYIPPHRLAAQKAAIEDKASAEFQRITWEDLRKAINGLINKANVANMANIVAELLRENLIRGRGLLCRAILKAQMASPGFTHVYASLIAIINTKLPQIGELLLKRIVIQFRRAFKRHNKVVAVALSKFIAHLVNQQVAHELVALQVITLMLERPTDDSVEVAINFMKECGQTLTELTPSGMNAIFDRFRSILHEGDIDIRVQYMIEGLFAVRKTKFVEHPSILPELDLVEREDQITHEVSLDDEALEAEEMLDVWAFDHTYAESESAWASIRAEILGADEPGESSSDVAAGDDAEALEVEGVATHQSVPTSQASGPSGDFAIADLSDTDITNLRRTIYLTIMNSLDFEECAHKLLKLKIPRGVESELANMLIECCSQERTYMRYYGLLGQRFCLISSVYQDAFEQSFAMQYSQIHRLETNKLRNVAKFFAHLLCTDALPWTVLQLIRVDEEHTNSSSRIFIKILIQELSEYMGLVQLRDRLLDPVMHEVFAGMFPIEDPRHTRFSINFFTSIGLGALTDDMRAHLKQAAKVATVAPSLPAPVPSHGTILPSRARSTSSSSSGSSYTRSSSYSSEYSSTSRSRVSVSSSSHSRAHSRPRSAGTAIRTAAIPSSPRRRSGSSQCNSAPTRKLPADDDDLMADERAKLAVRSNPEARSVPDVAATVRAARQRSPVCRKERYDEQMRKIATRSRSREHLRRGGSRSRSPARREKTRQ